jgi:hypothetical protein
MLPRRALCHACLAAKQALLRSLASVARDTFRAAHGTTASSCPTRSLASVAGDTLRVLGSAMPHCSRSAAPSPAPGFATPSPACGRLGYAEAGRPPCVPVPKAARRTTAVQLSPRISGGSTELEPQPASVFRHIATASPGPRVGPLTRPAPGVAWPGAGDATRPPGPKTHGV